MKIYNPFYHFISNFFFNRGYIKKSNRKLAVIFFDVISMDITSKKNAKKTEAAALREKIKGFK